MAALTYYFLYNTMALEKAGDKMLLMYTAMIEEMPARTRFERIYDNYCKQMVFVAMGVLHNTQDAEDAVQNALLGIARNMQNVPEDDRIERAYVLTAAKNAALNLLPGKQLRDSIQDISDLPIPSTEDLFQKVLDSQNYDLLLRAMQQLESPYREVLMLIYVQEQSIKEAAKILCRKEETVKKQLQRGKTQLIALCRKEGMCFE
jgi:RNA polymerase sigma-70 factor (ECF subfamily)